MRQLLSFRLEQLRAQQQAAQVNVPPVATKATKAATKSQSKDRVNVNADFRYRFEAFDIEDTPDRHRNRLRARVGMTAAVTDNTQLGFELASGSEDPVSTNQSLGNDFSTKPVNIDQAYLRW